MSLLSKLRRSTQSAPMSDPLARMADDPASESDRLTVQGRYALLLDREHGKTDSDRVRALAWLALEKDMAFVPAPGVGRRTFGAGRRRKTRLRFPRYISTVTSPRMRNSLSLWLMTVTGSWTFWPQSIWPNLVQFVDSTGHPGPALLE